ncbi:MAG: SPW repeat protein [Gracilibacteraceae bacterium]|jgi:hypothetical protein|nr:SPW repeat protein [Gracilibacteraceae bacterium]
MRGFIARITAFLGIWLMASPWFCGYATDIAKIHDVAAGVVIVGLSVIIIRQRHTKGQKSPSWPLGLNAAVGIWLIINGSVVFGATALGSRLNNILVGCLLAGCSLLAQQIIEGSNFFIFTKEGGELVEVSKVVLKDGFIEMKGKAFGSMPQVMHVRPKQIWLLMGLLPAEILIALPSLLWRGWRDNKEKIE